MKKVWKIAPKIGAKDAQKSAKLFKCAKIWLTVQNAQNCEKHTKKLQKNKCKTKKISTAGKNLHGGRLLHPAIFSATKSPLASC